MTEQDNSDTIWQEKVFYLCDDESENLYTGRITRYDYELTEQVRRVKIGEIHQLSPTTYLIRDK